MPDDCAVWPARGSFGPACGPASARAREICLPARVGTHIVAVSNAHTLSCTRAYRLLTHSNVIRRLDNGPCVTAKPRARTCVSKAPPTHTHTHTHTNTLVLLVCSTVRLSKALEPLWRATRLVRVVNPRQSRVQLPAEWALFWPRLRKPTRRQRVRGSTTATTKNSGPPEHAHPKYSRNKSKKKQPRTRRSSAPPGTRGRQAPATAIPAPPPARTRSAARRHPPRRRQQRRRGWQPQRPS